MSDNDFLLILDSLTKEEKIGTISYLKKQLKETIYEIPITIFDNDKLSSLEAIVKFYREELGISFIKISKTLCHKFLIVFIAPLLGGSLRKKFSHLRTRHDQSYFFSKSR